MSRHRNFANYDYEEDLLSDEEADFYGKSCEDAPLTPGASQYLYNRNAPFPPARASNSVDDFIVEEEANEYGEDEELFQMNDVAPKPKFELGESSEMKKPPKPEEKPQDLPPPPVIPAVQQLRISEQTPVQQRTSKSPSRMTPNLSFQKLSAIEMAVASTPMFKRRERPKVGKDSVNLVIVGHVDAGKSTLMGHLLCQLGYVDVKTLNKYKQEASRLGKASFFYAWILDMTEEERNRGVTMDIARAYFETEKKRFNVLDAPGHKDFIPNMITGASQSDAALLVVNATPGEFETGFDRGGQTREHALLLRSLGVVHLIVAVNKLDTVEWSKNRFDEVEAILRTFLQKQAGFSKITFVPVSGLSGDNLTKKPKDGHLLTAWYNGPTLIEALESLPPPERTEDLPLRIVVNDVLKLTTNMISLSCKIEAGHVEAGDKVFLMPRADAATVKGVCVDDSSASGPPTTANASEVCFSGEQVLISLSGTFEADSIGPGVVICRGGPDCLVPCKKFDARVVVFDILMPIIKGTKAELFAHSMCVPCTISLLKYTLNRSNGEILKEKPRHLIKNSSAVIQITTESLANLEAYSKCKALGRITLRAAGQTIAAGIIDEVYP
uniref:Tr-type G domain-containing protein n=1 Tax=Panagrolaimus sp. JU765 TaxID=591449 RepID=A0AC34R676_9BILA